jgi:hypothetical protein
MEPFCYLLYRWKLCWFNVRKWYGVHLWLEPILLVWQRGGRGGGDLSWLIITLFLQELLEKYASETLMQQSQDAKTLLGLQWECIGEHVHHYQPTSRSHKMIAVAICIQSEHCIILHPVQFYVDDIHVSLQNIVIYMINILPSVIFLLLWRNVKESFVWSIWIWFQSFSNNG